MNAEYIGDGVYVESWQGPDGGVTLTTSNGLSETNRIVLEPDVFRSLLAYARAHAPYLLAGLEVPK